MQKLLLAAAAVAGLGMGVPAAFAQATPTRPGAVASTPNADPAPTMQAQNAPRTSWTEGTTNTSASTDPVPQWKHGIPWAPSNPYAYDNAGG